MAIEKIDINNEENRIYLVENQKNRLDGNIQENKKVFDNFSTKVIVPKFNSLVDTLIKENGAKNVGIDFKETKNIEDAIKKIDYRLDNEIKNNLIEELNKKETKENILKISKNYFKEEIKPEIESVQEKIKLLNTDFNTFTENINSTTSNLESKNNEFKTQINELLNNEISKINKNLINTIYPIGSIYLTIKNDNPNNLFLNTEWKEIAMGRMLMGGGNGQTGGSNSIRLTEGHLPRHRHEFHTGYDGKTAYIECRSPYGGESGEMFDNEHCITGNLITQRKTLRAVGAGWGAGEREGFGFTLNTKHMHYGETDMTGSNEWINITNEYFKVRIWERIK